MERNDESAQVNCKISIGVIQGQELFEGYQSSFSSDFSWQV